MTPEKEQKLIDLAPYMFRYPGWDNLQISLMTYGFACGNGWYDLLKTLILNLREIDLEKEIRVGQVKEKSGGLRFYLNPLTNVSLSEKVRAIINKAEDASYHITEEQL